MELRPYQKEAKTAVLSQWEQGNSKTLLVLPTGCGKTIVFAKIAEDRVRNGERVLILAHRGELLEQAADKILNACGLGCAVIYCHHHSKGAQGGKRSMDRASGSGVFARDPDALLDLTELELTDSIIKHEKDKMTCKICYDQLKKCGHEDDVSQDDICSAKQMREALRNAVPDADYKHVCDFITKCEKRTESRTAWRIEGTLREFPKFPPVNVWFDYPVHRIDKTDVLKDIQPDDGRAAGWQKNFSKKKTEKERKDERKESLETAFDACMIDGKVTLSGMAEYMGVTEKTVRNRIKEHGGFWIDDNEVGKKSK